MYEGLGVYKVGSKVMCLFDGSTYLTRAIERQSKLSLPQEENYITNFD